MRKSISVGPTMVNQFGAFGAAVASPGADSLLVSSADGVGTKLCLARTDAEFAGLGRDLVHHCINDILTCGARPLFFLDYLAFGKLDPERASAIVAGISAACSNHGCALVGGETAELPDIYQADACDLAGFIVGTVARGKLLDGSNIAVGDALIGLPSVGLHTNGYSLARALLAGCLDEPLCASVNPQTSGLDGDHGGDGGNASGPTIRDGLLAEHHCYLPDVIPLLDSNVILGIAHITGGGLLGNVPRMLPEGLSARLDPTCWPSPRIFELMETFGLTPIELYRTFNMGIGMALACRQDNAGLMLDAMSGAVIIGSVEEDLGAGRVMGLW
jgi:phosphoribosylformylglycinamidine cyclo-ligase